jgi:hypothetical protein
VPEEFLLCSLRDQSDSTEWFRRVAQTITGSHAPMIGVDHSPLPHPPL